MKKEKLLPFLIIENNTITGISKTTRKPMYENQMARNAGMIMTCNACDRIIFEDENWSAKEYQEYNGYCPDCAAETYNFGEKWKNIDEPATELREIK